MPKYLHILVTLGLFLWGGCKSAKIETIDFSDGSYEGELNRDKQKHGKGFFRWNDGSFYNGEYLRDLRHGQGRFLWANGESYEGVYVNDQRTGKGVYRWPDGSIYEGSFFKGKRHGNGEFTASDGIKYRGEWLHDQQHGRGTLTFPDGKTISGTWIKGELVSSNNLPPSSSQKPTLEITKLPEVELVEPEPEEVLPIKKSPIQESTIISAEREDTIQKIKPAPSTLIAESSSVSNEIPLPDEQAPPPPTPPTPETIEENNLPTSEEGSLPAKLDQASDEVTIWRGTPDDAEIKFITELINGLDTIKYRSSNLPFTGKMQIVDGSGILEGELNLTNGVLDGKEIFFDSNGKIIEENLWQNGHKVN